MGSYITKTDIQNIFGTDNVTTWSDLSGSGVEDENRINKAIAYAESLVNDSFRDGKYAIPFSPVPELIKDWCAKLAGVWLFLCRPKYKKVEREAAEGFSEIRDSVFDEIATYNAGQRSFDCTLAGSKNVNAPSS